MSVHEKKHVYETIYLKTVTNDADGVGYVANNSGEFYHFGPAAGTLTVNGQYNAYNPSVPGTPNNGGTAFTDTPATPGIDYFHTKISRYRFSTCSF
jgi:hypothetical protein